jgi:DNA-binding NarL/FixJ family response regulator
MFIPEPVLVGKRVLIVEDETLVAILIEDLLEECECSIIGPCSTVEKALEAARTETFDLAVLDVNVRGKMVSRWRSYSRNGISHSCSCPAMATARSRLARMTGRSAPNLSRETIW